MRKVRVRAVIQHDNKTLFVRLAKYPDFWCLPGGSVDAAEQLEQALSRELVEELGIKPDIGQLLYVHQFLANDKEQLEFIFNIINAHDYLDIDLSKTTHGELELAEVCFIDPQQAAVLPKFLVDELPVLDTSTPQTVKFFSYL